MAAAQHTWTVAPPPGAYLVVTKQGQEVERVRLTQLITRIGRNRDVCEAPCDHPSVSRVHAALQWHGEQGRPFIEDLCSAHGTPGA